VATLIDEALRHIDHVTVGGANSERASHVTHQPVKETVA
jgi:hypothetical protein